MDFCLFQVILVVFDVVNGVTVFGHITSRHEGDKIGRLSLAKCHRVSFREIKRIHGDTQVQNTVCKADKILIRIQLLCKVLFVEDADAFLHHGVFEARLIERFLDFEHLLHPCFLPCPLILIQVL